MRDIALTFFSASGGASQMVWRKDRPTVRVYDDARKVRVFAASWVWIDHEIRIQTDAMLARSLRVARVPQCVSTQTRGKAAEADSVHACIEHARTQPPM